MNSNRRRESLLRILKTSDRPVKGVDLAKELNVTRQVIVKDIALLRASGADILATSNGYIIYTTKNKEFEIKCKNKKAIRGRYHGRKYVCQGAL